MSDPNQPWGQPPSNPYGQQPPAANPYGQQPYGQQPYGQPGYGAPYQQSTRDPDKRPGTVTAAGVTTIVLSVLSFLLYAGLAVATFVARDEMVEAMEDELTAEQRDVFSGGDLATLISVVVIVFAVWCLIAVLLAILAMRRSNVARIILVVSAAMTALVSLLGITSLISGVTLIAGIVVIVLLFTGGANEWYSRRHEKSELPMGTSQPWG